MVMNPYAQRAGINPFAMTNGLPQQPKPLFQQKPPKSDALASALMQSAYASPPQSPFDAIGKLAMLWSGKRQQDRYLTGQEEKAQAEKEAESAQYRTLLEALASGQDPLQAGLASDNPDILKALAADRLKGPGPRKTVTINGRLVDAETGEQIADFPNLLSPEEMAQKKELAEAGRSSTSVNVGAGEKAWDTESAKLFAKRYDDISTQAQSANEMLALYDLAAVGIDSGVRTGLLGTEEQAVRRFGQMLGVGDADKIAGGELLTAVQNRMALLMRSPDSGMGMPGAVSDRDLIFLKEAQIGLDRSPEGNRKMLETFRRLEQRKIEVAQLADEYIQEQGRLDSGFNARVREYAEANPLFADLAAGGGAVAEEPYTPEQIEEEARRRGLIP